MTDNDMDSDLEERMEMVKDFVTEGRELLDDAEPQIIGMEKVALSSGKLDEEILNTIFRLFHSLKGTASFLDLQNIIGVTHEAETLLDIFREGGAMVTPYHVDLLCRTSDFIRTILDIVEHKYTDEGYEAEAEELIGDLRATISVLSSEEVTVVKDEYAPDVCKKELSGQIVSDAELESDCTSGPKPAPGPGQQDEGYALGPDLDDMKVSITPEMVRGFVVEAQELCEGAELALLGLEKAQDLNLAGQAFRAFHSIKGNAGFFGYGDLEKISHLAENVLDEIRNGEKAPDSATMSTLLAVVDAIRRGTNSLADGKEAEIPDFDQLCENLVSLAEEQAEAKQNNTGTTVQPETAPQVIASDELEQLLAASSPQDPPAPVPPEWPQDVLEPVEQSPNESPPSISPEQLRDKPPEPVLIEQPQDISGPVQARQPEELSRSALEDSAPSLPDMEFPVPALIGAAPSVSVTTDERLQPAAKTTADATKQQSPTQQQVIRVDIDKLDKMLDLVGELVIAESMVANNQDLSESQNDRFSKAVTQLDKISREIQEVAMSMRMIPLAGVFNKMVRLVRDLSHKANKQVDLKIVGEDTEVDKTIIEQISDPLVHLIRNAVDHGIETAAARLAARKPEMGSITIEAKHSAGEVWITVEDDGAGLNRQKIINKGIEKGLVKGDEEMRDEDIWGLIFEPGFSTAEKVSSISGRGVGMDVVRQNIEKLRGKVDIRSRPGAGTMFIIRIPLTLAIIEGMVVRVGGNRYTIPISSIKESFRPNPKQITNTPDGLEIVRIRGELQPVLRLHELYGVEPLHRQLEDGILIMVENSENKCCLFVDELLGHQQIVIKGLPGYLHHVKGISGCAILGDGEISMILDIASMISSVDEIMQLKAG